MKFLVFGAGSVGGYLGGKLALGGHEVSFVGRETTVSALRTSGVTVIEGSRATTTGNLQAHTNLPSALELMSPDLILLAVKAYDLEQASRQLAAGPDDLHVLSLLNGLGSEEHLRRSLAPARVFAGALTTAVETYAPARYHATVVRGLGLAGEHPRLIGAERALRAAGVKVRTYEDGARMKGAKLFSNLLGNATSAVTGMTVQEIYADEGLFRLEIAALREARHLLQKSGQGPVNLPGLPVAWLSRLITLPLAVLQPIMARLVVGGRGGKRPSLYLDVRRGRTEIEWLNGAIVRRGRRRGVATPANRILTEAVQQLEARAASESYVPLSRKELLERAAGAGVRELQGYNLSGPS